MTLSAVWLRPTGTRNELVLSDRGGPGNVIYTTPDGVAFDLDEAGRVAIATFSLSGSALDAELFLYEDGRARSVATRGAAAPGGDEHPGWVTFSAGKVVWSVGLMLTTVRQADVVDLATGAATRVGASETYCGYERATQRHVAFFCPGGSSRLYDVATGKTLDFAPASELHAYPSALVWREPDEAGAKTRTWIVTPVIP